MNIESISQASQSSGGISSSASVSDDFTKSINKQIEDAEKQLQDISKNKNMSVEEKIKERQEINQKITQLRQELRQHQIELMQQKNSLADSSVNENDTNQKKNAVQDDTPAATYEKMPEATMMSLVTADSALKLAGMQKKTVMKMNGEAGVLEAEIKLDQGRGHSAAAKSGALADINAKAENAVSLQLSTLSVAQKAIDKTESRDMAESGNKPEDKNMAESGNKSVSKDSAGKKSADDNQKNKDSDSDDISAADAYTG